MPTLILDLARAGIHAQKDGSKYRLYQTTAETAITAMTNPAIMTTASYRLLPNRSGYLWTTKEAQRLADKEVKV